MAVIGSLGEMDYFYFQALVTRQSTWETESFKTSFPQPSLHKDKDTKYLYSWKVNGDALTATAKGPIVAKARSIASSSPEGNVAQRLALARIAIVL